MSDKVNFNSSFNSVMNLASLTPVPNNQFAPPNTTAMSIAAPPTQVVGAASVAAAQSQATISNKNETTVPAPSTPAAASAPQASGAACSAQDGAKLVKDFLSGDGEINCLNSFFQTTYHFRLFMTPMTDPYLATENTTQPAQVYAAVAAMPQITLAETGVTTYNIKSVSIESKIGPNAATRSVNTTKMTIVVAEPMGVGFIDSIKLSAEQLKINDYNKCWYYLELRFLAYDEAGNVVGNPIKSLNLDGVDRYIWQIQIGDIDVHLDAGGGTYTLQCLQYNDVGWDGDIKEIPENVSVSGGTLDEMFKNLAGHMNESWQQRHGNSVVQWGGKVKGKDKDIPAFVWHGIDHAFGPTPPPGINPNPGGWTAVTLDKDSMRSYDLLTGEPGAQFQNGMTMDKMIEAAFLSTKEATKMVTAAPVNGVREIICFRIIPEVYLDGFEYFSKQYYRVISYHIFPYYTLAAISDTQQPEDAKNPQTAGLYLEKLLKKGFMKKHYNYIYTGLNTEITNFDIHYNVKWCVLLPKLEGMRSSFQSVDPGPRFNGNPNNKGVSAQVLKEATDAQAAAQAQYTANSALQAKMDKAQSLGALIESLPANDPKKAGLMASYKAQVGAPDMTSAKNMLDTQQIQLSNLTKASNIATSKLLGETTVTGQTNYGEDYLAANVAQSDSTPDANSPLNLAVAFTQGFKEVDDAKGTGIENSDPSKSVFAAVVDQLSGNDLNQFVNITLEIRGDPYWLGCTNLAASCYARAFIDTKTDHGYNPDSDMPDPTRGDFPFLLKFRYPIQMGADFLPVFRDDEVFNGVYRANTITHNFADGMFKQTLNANRFPLIDIKKAKAYQGITDDSINSPVAGAGNGGARATLSNGGKNSIAPDCGDGKAHPVAGMSMSASGTAALQAREGGLLTTAYDDGSGNLTIGYGHTGAMPDGSPIRSGSTITPEQASTLYQQDLATAQAAVQKNITVPLTQNQFDSLTSVAYNAGGGNFAKMYVTTDVNAGNAGNADLMAKDLMSSATSRGVYNNGLANRRQGEIQQFNAQPIQGNT